MVGKWLGLFLSVLSVGTLNGAAYAWFPHGEPPADLICNFLTGNCTGNGSGTALFTPGTCNGVADDAAAFASVNAFLQTWQGTHAGLLPQVNLGPSGATCIISSDTVSCSSIAVSPNIKCPAAGLKRVRYVGYGVTLKLSNPVSLAGSGTIQGTGFVSVRLATVSAGATCVTATSNADGSTPPTFTNFAVGRYALIGGFDLQGIYGASYGFPTNLYFYEYHKVISIDSGTGQVCFDAALSHGYKSTWPKFYGGGVNGVGDQGGPATLFALDPSWDTEVEWRGITMPDRTDTSSAMEAPGRSVKFRDVNFTGSLCAVPSENLTYTYQTVTASACLLEIDKLIATVNFIGGTIFAVAMQNAAPDTMNVSGTTFTARGAGFSEPNSFGGTPKNFVGVNATIPILGVGVEAFGVSSSFYCSGCNIGTVVNTAIWEKGFQDSGINNTSTTCSTASSCWTMSGGIITIPNAASAGANPITNQLRWAVPGANFCFRGQYDCEAIGQVTDVTQDITNSYVHTTFAGGYPTVPLDAGKLYIQVHPAPQFTCAGCTGAAGSVLANYPASAPLYSYSTASYTGATGVTSTFGIYGWGNLSSLSINLTNAYSGVGALTFTVDQSSNWPIINSAGSAVSYAPVIDAKTTGNRIITLANVTNGKASDCGGAGTGCLTAPDAVTSWVNGSTVSGQAWSADVSASCPGAGCPAVTVTLQTTQGVVPGP